MAEVPQNRPTAAVGDGVQLYQPSTDGSLAAIVKKRRVEVWLDAIPEGEQLLSPIVAPDMDFILYSDWLHWAGDIACSRLHNLDRLERHLRTTALAYHRVPYQIRHSSTLLSGAKANPITLAILSQAFESGESRSRLHHLKPFHMVKDAAVEVLGEIRRLKANPVTIDEIRMRERKCEKLLEPLPQLVFELVNNLKWLRGIVSEITERANTDGSDTLAQKHSREGSLFRLWILSLLEMEFGLESVRSTHVNWYAERLLEYGVEKVTPWSKMADLTDLVEEEDSL